jgi:hypothetical protein
MLNGAQPLSHHARCEYWQACAPGLLYMMSGNFERVSPQGAASPGDEVCQVLCNLSICFIIIIKLPN